MKYKHRMKISILTLRRLKEIKSKAMKNQQEVNIKINQS